MDDETDAQQTWTHKQIINYTMERLAQGECKKTQLFIHRVACAIQSALVERCSKSKDELHLSFQRWSPKKRKLNEADIRVHYSQKLTSDTEFVFDGRVVCIRPPGNHLHIADVGGIPFYISGQQYPNDADYLSVPWIMSASKDLQTLNYIMEKQNKSRRSSTKDR